MKVVVSWSLIIRSAKRQGRLRMEGRIEEADDEERCLKGIVDKADSILLDIPRESVHKDEVSSVTMDCIVDELFGD